MNRKAEDALKNYSYLRMLAIPKLFTERRILDLRAKVEIKGQGTSKAARLLSQYVEMLRSARAELKKAIKIKSSLMGETPEIQALKNQEQKLTNNINEAASWLRKKKRK